MMPLVYGRKESLLGIFADACVWGIRKRKEGESGDDGIWGGRNGANNDGNDDNMV